MKTGPGRNSNWLVFWLKIDVPVTSRRQQVGRALDSFEGAAHAACQGSRQHRLGDPRNVLQQQVSAAEPGHQRQDQLFSFADDRLFHIPNDPFGKIANVCRSCDASLGGAALADGLPPEGSVCSPFRSLAGFRPDGLAVGGDIDNPLWAEDSMDGIGIAAIIVIDARPAPVTGRCVGKQAIETPSLDGKTMLEIPNLLVTDDDSAFRRVVCEGLTRRGFRVTEARDGQEAIEVLQRAQVHVALLDFTCLAFPAWR